MSGSLVVVSNVANTASPECEQAGGGETCQEHGLHLFYMQRKRLQAEETKQRAESIRVMEDVAADSSLPVSKKAVFAETMREVCVYVHYCYWISY